MQQRSGDALLLAVVVAGLLLCALAATGSRGFGAASSGLASTTHEAGLLAPAPTPTSTPDPTASGGCEPWRCPTLTPEPLWVDPVTSPAYVRSQTVSVWLGNGEVVTITAESGTFTATQSYGPMQVEVGLLPGVTHHLLVAGRVKMGPPPCCYGGYTLWTTRDRNGDPLTIEHRVFPAWSYLPLAARRWEPGPGP